MHILPDISHEEAELETTGCVTSSSTTSPACVVYARTISPMPMSVRQPINAWPRKLMFCTKHKCADECGA